ncbi:MAG: arylsulfatase A [Verrucomicrobiales bacterium]|jgi:arylsulfatase A
MLRPLSVGKSPGTLVLKLEIAEDFRFGIWIAVFSSRMIRVFLFLLVLQTSVFAADKPNFVLIYIDDMGYGDIGPFGSKLNRTPNLDRMAEEGMKLTSFYAAPVCSASRAQLMTGSYAPRVSVPGVFFPAGKNGLNPDEHTVADYLKELGYSTMCVGKWHLGDQREFLPTKHGFDGYFGIPYSNDMQRVSSETGKRVHPLVRDTEVAELLEDEGQRRVTREYTEEGVKFIEANAGGEKPFFLYLPHTAMHVPLFPHADFAGKSKNGVYGDWVEEVDWSVGQLLAALKRLKVEENTLVLFTSDNGPWASKGAAGGVSGPLRGSKGCTLEGGVREPTIAWWPGKIEPGSVSDAIAGTTDVLPTFVSLAGGKPREDVKIDGLDISKVLLGETADSGREAWFYFQGTKLQAVRSGSWKLALTAQSIGMGMKETPEDLATGGRLYNLDEEIGEVTNLAEKNPEVVERLRKLGEEFATELASNTRPAGVVENPVTLYPTQPRSQGGGSTKKPAGGKPIDWAKVKAGDVYAPASAPGVANKPFTVSCMIDGEKPSGVIVAHGGSAVGYSLYLKDGQIVFAVRGGSGVDRIEAPAAAGATEIAASLGKGGKLSLSVNDGAPVTAKAGGLLNRHPQEDFCVGHDNKNAVDEEAPKGSFTGTISDLKVSL